MAETVASGTYIPLQELAKHATLGNYPAPDAPNYAEILRCTHCGLCLDHCPTYRVLDIESDSPRGRIYQMRAVAEGRYEVNADFKEHMNVCLACRACETACPANVGFGQLVEAARWQAVASLPMSRRERLLRWLILRQLFPHPWRLRLAGSLLRLYQRLGLQSLVRRTGLLRLLSPTLAQIESLSPQFSNFFTPARDQFFLARGKARGTVSLFSGCIMPLAYSSTNQATLRVLQRNGFHVLLPAGQICCGAIHIHAGEHPTAQEMARRNIDAFLREETDAIIVNAAGCGVALKEYGELLANDAVYAQRAREFSAKVRDVSEFLVDKGFLPPRGEVRRRVTYQDPCHLAHGQKVRSQPRAILRAIPGIQLVEMRDPDRCCGSAGIYNVVHPDLSRQILNEKLDNVKATGAEMVVSANPGCILQIEAGCRNANLDIQVAHVADLLDQAYRAEKHVPPDP
ncbi:MAG: 4Fe-4S dicluster domain-containing protein [Anaerolineae bacterium]|nr:4Fe-4S dicluster domain-containing protein [Anaerolineae bacterium]